MQTQPTATAGNASHPDPIRFVSEECRAELVARRAICEPCDLQRGFTALTVKCKRCGCAGLSLLHGRCPLRKWDSDESDDGNGDAVAKAKQADSPINAKKEKRRLRSGEQPAAPRTDPIDEAVKECEQAANAPRVVVQCQPLPRDVGEEPGRIKRVIDRIAVIGHPSRVGGADTELDH